MLPASMTTGEVSCSHCGLPVPEGLVDAQAELQFCCDGCRTVYAVLHEHGLEGYYALQQEEADKAEPAKTTGRRYAEYDDPTFFELYCRRLPDGRAETELFLEGIHCAACIWLVERVPVVQDGVLEVRLDMGRSRALVSWDPERVKLSRIARLLDSMGYPVHPYRRSESENIARREDRKMLIRLGITGAAAGNVMLIAFALYGGMFHGMAAEYENYFRWVSLLITIPALIWGGGVFFRGAVASFRTRTLHMDLPISIGILAGFAWGAFNTLRGSGEIYFESVTALIFLLLAGRFIQRRRQRSAADAAELLYSLSPAVARLIEGPGAEGDQVREVPVGALIPGALVEVRAGDLIPADAVVTDGESTIDMSLLTGESRPVAAFRGEEVYAGTLNLASRLVLRVETTGGETRVGQLMAMVEEFSRRKAPIVQLADRLAGYFTAAVLGLAVVTFGLWLWLEPASPGNAVEHAIALLIVTCPCALGLATPLAVSAAIGQAARRGILLRGADLLEQLTHPGCMWLDKTGTLTEGKTRLMRWSGDEGLAAAVAAVEAQSNHPVARAFVEVFEPDLSLEIAGLEQTTGGGMTALVEGRPLIVGSPAFLERRLGRPLEEGARRRVAELIREGLTPVLIALDGKLVASAGFGDPLRKEAPGALQEIRARGWRVGILSGDHPDLVAAVARQLGVEGDQCRGGVLPEEKLAVVEASGRAGPVVMVGDGVNDAAALAAATVGIGVHGGAEAALAAADAYLMREGIAPITELLVGARRTMRVIHLNLALSLIYNLVGVGLAMAGLINPLLAAVLMPASSLTVISISYRARTFR